jgi:hypothetical protein
MTDEELRIGRVISVGILAGLWVVMLGILCFGHPIADWIIRR